MLTIWKYKLKHGANRIEIPQDFNVLSVTHLRGDIILHCLVNPSNQKIESQFDVVYAGEKLNDSFKNREFIGTVVNGKTSHVFQVVKH
jgi:hypothetical protein